MREGGGGGGGVCMNRSCLCVVPRRVCRNFPSLVLLLVVYLSLLFSLFPSCFFATRVFVVLALSSTHLRLSASIRERERKPPPLPLLFSPFSSSLVQWLTTLKLPLYSSKSVQVRYQPLSDPPHPLTRSPSRRKCFISPQTFRTATTRRRARATGGGAWDGEGRARERL